MDAKVMSAAERKTKFVSCGQCVVARQGYGGIIRMLHTLSPVRRDLLLRTEEHRAMQIWISSALGRTTRPPVLSCLSSGSGDAARDKSSKSSSTPLLLSLVDSTSCISMDHPSAPSLQLATWDLRNMSTGTWPNERTSCSVNSARGVSAAITTRM